MNHRKSFIWGATISLVWTTHGAACPGPNQLEISDNYYHISYESWRKVQPNADFPIFGYCIVSKNDNYVPVGWIEPHTGTAILSGTATRTSPLLHTQFSDQQGVLVDAQLNYGRQRTAPANAIRPREGQTASGVEDQGRRMLLAGVIASSFQSAIIEKEVEVGTLRADAKSILLDDALVLQIEFQIIGPQDLSEYFIHVVEPNYVYLDGPFLNSNHGYVRLPDIFPPHPMPGDGYAHKLSVSSGMLRFYVDSSGGGPTALSDIQISFWNGSGLIGLFQASTYTGTEFWTPAN